MRRIPTTFRVTKKSLLIHSDMLLLVLHTAVVKKKSLNTPFLIKYNEKVTVAENEEKTKQKTNKQEQ